MVTKPLVLTQRCNKHLSTRGKVGFGLLLLVSLCTVSSYLFSVVQQRKEQQHLLQFRQIVLSIQNGSLKPDQSGDIILPSRFAGLTANGRVYLSRDPKYPFIFFPAQINAINVEWQRTAAEATPPHRAYA